jgi:tetratricopeptide (TPR) repeat protein
MFERADAYRPAYADFTRALEANPRDARAFEGLLKTMVTAERVNETRTLLSRLAADPGNDPAKLAYSRFLAAQGAYEDAAKIAFGVIQTNTSNVAALEQMASILSDVGDRERMVPIVSRLRAEAPASEAAHYYSAALLFLEGRTDLALREAQAVIARNPGHAKAQNLKGACLATLGQRDQARAAFHASLAADPKEPATYTNLANLELEAGNEEQAVQYFAEALTIDPNSETALAGLARLRARS